MLKSATNGTTSARPPFLTIPKFLLDSGSQGRTNSPLQSRLPKKWHAYINGGAQEDDARMLQKGRKEDVEFEDSRRNDTLTPAAEVATKNGAADASQELVETLLQKSTALVSGHMDPLVDVGINASNETHPLRQPGVGYTSPVRSQGAIFGGPEWSLLD